MVSTSRKAHTHHAVSPDCLIDLEKGSSVSPSPPNEKSTDEQDAARQRVKDAPTSTPEEHDPNIIDFTSPTDATNPQNWRFRQKCTVTFILAGMTFTTTFTSSIFSTAITATSTQFHTSTELMTLGTSLFLLGFTLGPIIWGPLSELYGRRLPLLIGVGAMGCFQVGVAVAQNVYTIFICRFFAGVFGVSPLCVVGGALADFWNPVQRGATVGIYAMCTFVGPVAAPIMGGYVVESWLGWRWTEYVSVIMGEWALFFFFFFWSGRVLCVSDGRCSWAVLVCGAGSSAGIVASTDIACEGGEVEEGDGQLGVACEGG